MKEEFRDKNLANIVFDNIVSNPEVLQAQTDLIRTLVKNAREALKLISDETCQAIHNGLKCQLLVNHNSDHSHTVVWKGGNGGSYLSPGTQNEDGDSRE